MCGVGVGKEVDCQIGGVGKNPKLKMKKKMPMDTKLWYRLRSTYASYQQRVISLGDLL